MLDEYECIFHCNRLVEEEGDRGKDRARVGEGERKREIGEGREKREKRNSLWASLGKTDGVNSTPPLSGN